MIVSIQYNAAEMRPHASEVRLDQEMWQSFHLAVCWAVILGCELPYREEARLATAAAEVPANRQRQRPASAAGC